MCSVRASMIDGRSEDEASCSLVRPEEYPLYLAVCVAANVVCECGSEYCECYVVAEHTAVYGTVLLTEGCCVTTGLVYPAPEDESV